MNQGLYTDTSILEGLAIGDRSAVEQMYRLYHPMLTKWMISKGGEANDADDIFQETLLVIYEKAQDPEFCLTSKLSTYLFAISKRIWFQKMNKDKNTYSYDTLLNEEADEYEQDLSYFLTQEKKFREMWLAMEQLGEPCNQLLKAFYIENKNMQEISEMFNYNNTDTAKNQRYKCLNRLKKIYFELSAKHLE